MTRYLCGFYPSRKPLRVIAEHWRQCRNPECAEFRERYESIREWFIDWYGSREQQERMQKAESDVAA